MDELEIYNANPLESIKNIDKYGNEFWYANELQTLLDYKNWKNFKKVIEKAKTACKNSGNNVFDHFGSADKMISNNSNTQQSKNDYKLSRYACYLIAQNGDSRKKAIAMVKTYIATQTRKQELLEQNNMKEWVTQLFVMSQAQAKIERENIQKESDAKKIHYEIDKNVREFINN